VPVAPKPVPVVEKEPETQEPASVPVMDIDGETSFSVSGQLALNMNGTYFLIQLLKTDTDSVQALVGDSALQLTTGKSQMVFIGKEKIYITLKGTTGDTANFVVSNKKVPEKKITAKTIAPVEEQPNYWPFYLFGSLVATAISLYIYTRKSRPEPGDNQ